MVLDHAPVTGLAILFSSLSAAITNDKYNRPPHRLSLRSSMSGSAAAALAAAQRSSTSVLTTVKRLSLSSLPFGGLGASMEDILLTLGILVQMRTLERRWGSASFLAFLLNAAALGACALQLLAGPPTSDTGTLLDYFVPAAGYPRAGDGAGGGGARLYFTVEAVRVLTGAASLVPLTALVVRYMSEVPSSTGAGGRGLRIPGTTLVLTDRVTFVLPLLKLLLAPNGVLQPATHKRDGIIVTVGLWTRLLLALLGLAFGLASTRSPWLRGWLRLFADKVCRPILNAVRPVLITPIFGAAKVVAHALPPHIQQQQQRQQQDPDAFVVGAAAAAARRQGNRQAPRGGSQPQEGGRISVGSLSGPSDGPAAPRVPHPRSNDNNPHRNSSHSRGGRNTDVSPAAVARILEMGLGRTEEEVAGALRVCGGDVAAAVNLLLSGD